MLGARPSPTRPRAFPGSTVLRRLCVLAVALVCFAVESLAVAHGVHGPACAHGPASDACDGHAHGCAHGHAHGHAHHADRGPDEPEAPDPEDGADACALCRVLAAVPTPIALPPALPAPAEAEATPAGASAAFVPACVLDLGLARGPPPPTRR